MSPKLITISQTAPLRPFKVSKVVFYLNLHHKFRIISKTSGLYLRLVLKEPTQNHLVSEPSTIILFIFILGSLAADCPIFEVITIGFGN